MRHLSKMSDVLVLAVKPQVLEKTLKTIAPSLRTETLVISVRRGRAHLGARSAASGRGPRGANDAEHAGHGARGRDGDLARDARDGRGHGDGAILVRGGRSCGDARRVVARCGDRIVRKRAGVRNADDRGAGGWRREGSDCIATRRSCSRRRRCTDRRSFCSRPGSIRGGSRTW